MTARPPRPCTSSENFSLFTVVCMCMWPSCSTTIQLWRFCCLNGINIGSLVQATTADHNEGNGPRAAAGGHGHALERWTLPAATSSTSAVSKFDRRLVRGMESALAAEAELRTVRRITWSAFAEALLDPSQL